MRGATAEEPKAEVNAPAEQPTGFARKSAACFERAHWQLRSREEQRLLDQSIDLLTKTMRKRPVGYRAPSWAMSRFTMKQVKEAGFLYDSSLMASDDAYEVTIDGQPSGLIELPIERILDDAPYYGAASGSLPSPELVDQVYRPEFDVAYQEGGLYVLTMHPHYSGHRSRALWLDKLITYMKSKPGVWFATHEEIANYLKSTY